MLRSPGNGDPGNFSVNEVSSPQAQSSDQRLLAKILSDDATGFSGSDKARSLIAALGDLHKVLRTELHRLRGIVPLSDDELSLLATMRRAVGSTSESDSLRKPTIGSLSALEAYLRCSSGRHLSLLLLDQHNRLQADVTFDTAVGQNHLPAAHDVIRVALEYGASATIVVQSRRSAVTLLDPSLINQAKVTERSLRVVGIMLQDYVLRSDHRLVSMRARGLICCSG